VTASPQIGSYRILGQLGAGGMGMVFVGEHVLLGRRAAIKTLQPLLAKQPDLVARFFHEARATSAIADPGVVQVFDFGYHVDGTAYIVMELLEGECLADRLDRLGSLPIASALRIARQVASSLAAAHARRIVHRDLKPENIFLVRDGEARSGERTKLLDFGVCSIAGAPATAAPERVMVGTPAYMSPEQCRGGERGDHRSDVYGLGCVLFEMLTGSTPFEHGRVRDVIRAHLDEEPLSVSSLREDVPAAIDELVRRCLAKAPGDRFASMDALGAELDRVLARLPPEPASAAAPAASVAASRPSPRPSVSWRSRSITFSAEVRHGSLRRAAIGLALLGGAVLASLAARLTEGDRAIARAATRPEAAYVERATPDLASQAP
jgi:eukaryotic-like serine/threonine-protein kinase